MHSKVALKTILDELYIKIKCVFNDDLDKVILYGSYARGDFREYSDIDVMVIVKSDEENIKNLECQIDFIGSRMSLDYDVVLSISVRNREHFNLWKEYLPYFKNIATEGVEISA
jgi:predicted nucleotidyltransferase